MKSYFTYFNEPEEKSLKTSKEILIAISAVSENKEQAQGIWTDPQGMQDDIILRASEIKKRLGIEGNKMTWAKNTFLTENYHNNNSPQQVE